MAIFPTVFHISSNGCTAALTALLTFLAAINATHINTRAMMSTIKVANIHPTALSAQVVSVGVPVGLTAFHLKTKSTHPNLKVVSVIFFTGSLVSPSWGITFLTIIFLASHITYQIVQPVV